MAHGAEKFGLRLIGVFSDVFGVLKFGELFASVPELKKGDVLATDWLPGIGTQMQRVLREVAEYSGADH